MNELLTLAVLAVALGGFLLLLFAAVRKTSSSANQPDDEPVPVATERDEQASQAPRAEEILERVGEGIVVLDRRLRATYVNATAKKILGFKEGALPARLPSQQIVNVAQRALETNTPAHDEVDLLYPLRMTLEVRAIPSEGQRDVLVMLRDLTEERMAQRIRREFVAHASHELKSPVAGLQALAEAIREAVEDDAQAVARFSNRMIVEAERLGRLVSDLLDLSKLEDAPSMPQQVVNLTEIAAKEAAHIGGVAQEKRTSFRFESTGDVWVKGDEQQLGLMMRNLLENAVRYTPEEGRVSLEVAGKSGLAVVRVSDNGIGIPADAQARVFERFYRVDRGRSRDRGGTGLGLAIVKHVAELHGGGVTVQSELGAGSVFTVHLPTVVAPHDARLLAG